MRAKEIADFLVRDELDLPCRFWKREELESWLEWCVWHGHCGLAMNKGQLVGVGIGRPIHHINDADRYYSVDYQGPLLWIDLVASTNPVGMKTVWQMALDRFGERQWVAFYRFKEQLKKAHVYDFERFKSKLKGK